MPCCGHGSSFFERASSWTATVSSAVKEMVGTTSGWLVFCGFQDGDDDLALRRLV